MTEKELANVMRLLERQYRNFYDGRNKQEVFEAWYPFFKDDNAEDVQTATVEVICSLRFPPTVADIKLQMSEDRLEDQPTSIEAFQMVNEAVDKAHDRTSASEAFNALPPIIRKLVVNPSQLISWRKVDESAFQTVVMSAIRESYTVLAKREAKYYALPAGVRKKAEWRIEGASTVALPEPKRQKSIDEILDDMDKSAKEYRERYGMTAPGNEEKVEKFKNLSPEEARSIERRMKGEKNEDQACD